jgi:hypothetical protein
MEITIQRVINVKTYWIWGYHGGKDVDIVLMGGDAVWNLR